MELDIEIIEDDNKYLPAGTYVGCLTELRGGEKTKWQDGVATDEKEKAVFYSFEVEHEGEKYIAKKSVTSKISPKSNLRKFTVSMYGKKITEENIKKNIKQILEGFVGHSFMVTIADTPEDGKTYINNIAALPASMKVPKREQVDIEKELAEANQEVDEIDF